MKSKILKLSLIMCSWLLASSAVHAGFDLTRMTTVVDDLSGSYTVSKNGRLEEMQFTGTSLTEFNQFHPRHEAPEAYIDGVISKVISRGNGSINTVSDGAFQVLSASGEWDVSFTGLQVNANEQGVELTGEVTVNGESFDAAKLPEGLAIMLRRVFWLTRR